MRQINDEQENYMIKPQEFQPLPCLLKLCSHTKNANHEKFLRTKDPNIMVDLIFGFSMFNFYHNLL
jgi:hypothetical protein